MAGVRVKITARDEQVRLAMRQLALGGDRGLIRMALKNIGVALVRPTRQRFSREQSPEGTPWKPLDPAYAAGKRGGKILQEQGMHGGLLGSIVWQLSDRRLEVCTNKVYGAIHQFGATIYPRWADRLAFRLGVKLARRGMRRVPSALGGGEGWVRWG